MSTTFASPQSIPASSPVSSPQLDSLQPVAASPQISRTAPPIQAPSPALTGTPFSPSLLSTSPTSSRGGSISPGPSHLRQRPALSPNPASRLSTASLSFSLSQRDSFVPQFPSSLSYTSVRDFAYPNLHPLHYGPQPGPETPASNRESQYLDSGGSGGGWYSGNTFGFGGSTSQYRRLSDPAYHSFGTGEGSGGWGGNWESSGSRREGGGKGAQLPPLRFEDGPPWSEDPDLHSPVVISTKHRKHKSSAAHLQSSQGYSRRPSKNAVHLSSHDFQVPAEASGSGWKDDGYLHRHSADIGEGEPGGEFHNHPGGGYYRDEHSFTGPDGPFVEGEDEELYSDEDEGLYAEENDEYIVGDPSRLSNQYFITIASPAEEMHGKAVALFDFQKENENELGLVEGQVIWVSYRHGMGWLVAEDPKTRESGLVPEEYVRLLRDIQQPLIVEGSGDDEDESDIDAATAGSPPANQGTTTYSNGMKPVVSTFSTSSQDVHPYQGPLHQPGEQAPRRTLSRSGQGGGTLQTPISGTWEDRIVALERERERALIEEELSSAYKSRSGSIGGGIGDETPRAVAGGSGWSGARRGSAGSEEGPGGWSARRMDGGLDYLDEGDEAPQPLPAEALNGMSFRDEEDDEYEEQEEQGQYEQEQEQGEHEQEQREDDELDQGQQDTGEGKGKEKATDTPSEPKCSKVMVGVTAATAAIVKDR